MRQLFACCIVVILLSGGSPALLSGQAVTSENLGIRDGLSQGYISCMLLDREGFLWTGTKNGLNRYDGRQFKVFTSDPANPWAIANDYILSISEYGDFLLVGTKGGGLNIFNKKNQRFYRLPDQLPGGGRLKSPVVSKAFVDAQKDIWILFWREKMYNEGSLCRLRVPPDFWKRLQHTNQPWSGIFVDSAYQQQFEVAYMSRDGKTLLLARTDSAYRIDTKTGQLESIPVQLKVGNFAEDSAGNIWSSSWEGLVKFEKTGFRVLPADFKIANIYCFDPQNRLHLSARQQGLLRFRPEKITTALHFQDADLTAPDLLSDKALVDYSGIIWLATSGYGLQKINPQRPNFQTYFPQQTIYSPPFTTADGAVGYFGFEIGLQIEPTTSRHPFAQRRQQLSYLKVSSRYLRDCLGNYWVFYFKAGQHHLLKIDADGQRQQHFVVRQNPERCGNFTLDNQCAIWMAQNGQLIRFDPVSERFDRHDYSNILSLGHEVRALAQTANRHWWIATEYGLVEAIPAGTGFSFKLYKQESGNLNSLRHENLAALLVDPKDANVLWIGTKGSGLERLDTRNGTFTHLSTKEGLPNNVIYGVLNDNAGNLWMSSNLGLIRYNPSTGSIKNFTEADGLLSNEFNTWAYAKAPNGDLMFGGVNGLHVFNPDDLKDNPVVPPVYFTGLKVNNHRVEPGDSSGLLALAPEWTTEITLPFAQNSIALEFAALEFSAPSKNRFRYYLEGAEPEWAHEGIEHSAQYLNLQPGRYTFKVTACNNDGKWNPTPAVLKIVVLPPWYRSVWAYLAYALFAGALVFGYLRFRLHRFRLQQQLALEHLEAERLKELDTFKSRFFTNISHEFRTPLTIIQGTAELLNQAVDASEKTGKSGLSSGFLLPKIALLRRNADNLLRLVNQVLDLAKLESKALTINYVCGDVIAYLRYVTESLHSLANAKNVLLRVESPAATIKMDYDPERLMQIVYNLLSNAIKFTPSGGRIIMRAETCTVEDQPCLQLSVTDSGAGISPEDLPRIFDRFFQAQNQGSAAGRATTVAGGSGIGLSLANELIKTMGGSISVSSTEGKGTVFVVLLPITCNAESVPAPLPSQLQTPNSQLQTPNFKLQTSNSCSLLLIEDNPDVVEYLSACLEGDYQLDFAYNGRAGIEKALETVPDIIISDVMMPEKDGFEVCETLKHDERTSHIPIVLLTARAGLEDRIAGLRRGADAYLSKPFHPEELQVVLSNLLDLRQKLQARYGMMMRTQEAQTAPDPEDTFLQKLRDAVEDRLSQADLSVEELSKVVGMSYPVVHRKVTALTGRSLTLFVRAVRLQKARTLLADPALSISDVAYETGFNDPKFFSRVFSEAYGMSPSAYRQSTG